MTQYRIEIPVEDRSAWQNWMNCAIMLQKDLRDLNDAKVTEILDRYEFRSCTYGMGLNIDWPDTT